MTISKDLALNLLLYADLNLNLIDGSSIWVRNLAEVLIRNTGLNVHVLCRGPLEDRGVAQALARMPGITLLSRMDYDDGGPDWGDRQRTLAAVIERIDSEVGLDRIVIRGLAAARAVAMQELRHRLWAYVLETPSLDLSRTPPALRQVVANARGLLVQSEAQRALIEAVFAEAAGKVDVLPPMVRPLSSPPPPREDAGTAVSFVYSGKYSADWNVEAYFDIPAACAARGVAATVTMIGDKVHHEKSDLDFRDRIMRKLEHTDGVRWLGAMEHEAAIQESAGHALGLCWRSASMDHSLEISTKFLEFASVGVPCVVNRTATYEALLGADYPYFASSLQDVVDAAASVRADPAAYALARERSQAIAADYGYERAAERLKHALDLSPPSARPVAGPPPTVLVASHDLKFFGLALDRLRDDRALSVIEDNWTTTTRHRPRQSESLLARADVVFCEWCFGQAVWYSARKRPGQKLYLRLHRAEAFTRFPRDVRADALDGVIVVSDHFKTLCIEQFGWPADKIVVLPQYCAAAQFDRPKFASAERVLGFVGINGFRHKRFDRAVEVLRLVRREKPEFRMRVRSAMPWEIPWIWNDPAEREQFRTLFAQIEDDAELRSAIQFDRSGANMAEWFRNVGYILSTSETEGCHTSVAEGICSGAVPVVIDWPGARSVYGDANVYASVEAMADAILATAAGPAPDRRRLQDDGAVGFDISRTVAQLEAWFRPGDGH